MKSCAFFGHADIDYRAYEDDIESIIIILIEKYNVTQFYTGGRGAFDGICSDILLKLKRSYPYIKNTLVLSYMPKKGQVLARKYDDSVYLLEQNVPPRCAIIQTNKALVDKVDFVVTAVRRNWGGAKIAYDYAYKRGKIFVNIFWRRRGVCFLFSYVEIFALLRTDGSELGYFL